MIMEHEEVDGRPRPYDGGNEGDSPRENSEPAVCRKQLHMQYLPTCRNADRAQCCAALGAGTRVDRCSVVVLVVGQEEDLRVCAGSVSLPQDEQDDAGIIAVGRAAFQCDVAGRAIRRRWRLHWGRCRRPRCGRRRRPARHADHASLSGTPPCREPPLAIGN